MPKGVRAGRPPVWPRRQLIDGIRFRVRTGVPWRDVPVEYGQWNRVYDLFRRWQRNGTWQRILTRLQSLADAKGAIAWDLNVDSTVCRAHQHAAGARNRGDQQKEPPGGVFTEPGDHGLGRSRGGFTTKLHLAVEQGQKPMAILVTAGQRGDSPQFETRAGESPRASHRAGPATRSSRSGPRGQGVRLPKEPRLPASPRDPLHHPGQGRPGPQPPEARIPRWPTATFRPHRPPVGRQKQVRAALLDWVESVANAVGDEAEATIVMP
ncbi:UNVERIFIED_CONTAM: transposase [Streptomyces graminofaciens]